MHECREYILGLKMELVRKEETHDDKRLCELSSYFTNCKLQSVHLQLSLRSAMILNFKHKNFQTCAIFARRLLELDPAPQTAQQVIKLIKG